MLNMNWVTKFDLFLFDFDGLLVNTEALHLKAYQKMCEERGFELDWDLNYFFRHAHVDAFALRREIGRVHPKLFEQEPEWNVLYAEKKAIYQELLEEGELELMPGVELLLLALQEKDRNRCVATNSAKIQVEKIKEKIPVLKTIPLWITREDYTEPKPSPECYLLAQKKLKKPGDKTIGFEDSLRGYEALSQSGVTLPLLICHLDHPQMDRLPSGIVHFPTLADIRFS
jgi:HAD superfamily hydrolase (TIGR01509 family)